MQISIAGIRFRAVQHIGLAAGLQSAELIERDGSRILDRTKERIRTISSLSNGDEDSPHLSQPVMWLRSRADPCDRRLSMAMAT
jgi:hypothetical protein